MNLRTKLIIGFIAIMFTVTAIGIISVLNMNNIQREMDNLNYKQFEKFNGALSALDSVNRIGREVVNEIVNPGVRTQAINDEIELYGRRFRATLDYLLEQDVTVEEHKAFLNLNIHWTHFTNFVSDAMELCKANKPREANALRNEVGLEYQTTLLNALDDLTTIIEANIEDQRTQSFQEYRKSVMITVILMGVGILLSLSIMFWIMPGAIQNLNTMSKMIQCLAKGNFRAIRRFKPYVKDEIGEVIDVFKKMAQDLEEQKAREEDYQRHQREQVWINSHVAKLTELLSGEMNIHHVTQTFISEFAPVLEAQYGALYLREKSESKDQLVRSGTYAVSDVMQTKACFPLGQGLVGQCAEDQRPIIVNDLSDVDLNIVTGITRAKVAEIVLYPIIFEQRVLGVLELASIRPMNSASRELIEQLTKSVAVILHTINERMKMGVLLQESQTLTEELRCQSEELISQQEAMRRSNEYLEAQTEALRQSEELLQQQQKELERYNTELITQQAALENTMKATRQKNDELEEARALLERQTLELALASKYKSEFLANMSHELRTPLNSLLILSQLLAENKEGNLLEKQVEYARTINMSGSDLLAMIDEILDLAKIDSGHMKVELGSIDLKQFISYMYDSFAPIAEQKGLAFNIHISDSVPRELITDEYRLKQIVRNLLSNAFKFTNTGQVQLRVDRTESSDGSHCLISVADTGIGIPIDMQGIIFEAFQQVDGTSCRKYGGAGLGLSISRELAHLLGGQLEVISEEGHGSIFTVKLPIKSSEEEWFAAFREGGTGKLSPVDQWLREMTIKLAGSLSAETQDEGETERASIQPSSIITRQQEQTNDADIPMFTTLPFHKFLVIDKEAIFRQTIVELLNQEQIAVKEAGTGQEALNLLKEEHFDGIIMNADLSDMMGDYYVAQLNQTSGLEPIPIIVYVNSLLEHHQSALYQQAHSFLIRTPDFYDELLQAVRTLFDPIEHQSSLKDQFFQDANDTLLTGKRVLIADDDVRNVFALSSLLEQYDMVTQYAENGRVVLEMLEQDPDFDVILIDMMMPEVDGYEVMKRIRMQEKFKNIPIIAMTAKSMKEDRVMCMEAGASEYLTKPLNRVQLVTVLRACLLQNDEQ